MPCVYLPGPAPAVTVANIYIVNTELSALVTKGTAVNRQLSVLIKPEVGISK